MSFLDISAPLTRELPVFPGDPPVNLEPFPAGPFRLTRLCCGSHSGTHVDAPRHLLTDGPGVEALALDSLIGPCRVFDLSDRGSLLDVADFRTLQLQGVRRALLRTSAVPFWHSPRANDTVLTPAAAEYLAAQKLDLLGIDGLSVEATAGEGDVHRPLLKAGTIILEGLDLSSVAAGDYELLCLPLLLPGSDGAPCRAVLRTRTRGSA